MHKSLTGYCAKHIERHSRTPVRTHEGRTCSDPHLVEEDTRGFYMPKVL